MMDRAQCASLSAQLGLTFATVAAGGLLVFDGGLYPFAAGLLFATLAQGVAQASSPRGHSAPLPSCVESMLWLALAIIALASISASLHGRSAESLDHVARLLLIPWCAWLAHAVRLPRIAVWYGSLLGLLVAVAVASWQIQGGEPRAGGGGNPIVFANLVSGLLAVALFAGPRTAGLRTWPPLVAWLAGGLAIVWSGSRGALLVWAALGVLAWMRHGDSRRRVRWLALALPGAAVMLGLVGWLGLHAPLRLEQIEPNLVRFAHGDPDSPIGARLELLGLAWQGFLGHPWIGVGIENFGSLVRGLPGCRLPSPMGMCVLTHAHNDFAEWAATMGLPGLVGIIALYGLPLACFIRIIREAAGMPGASAQAAWAGVALVGVYLGSGLSQSIFAHAATASAYAVFVGLLLGVALHECADQLPGAKRGIADR